jgi:hypothetical protein
METEKKSFIDRLSKDKVFLLSMLEDPIRTLQEYDYCVKEDQPINKQLIRIRELEIKLLAGMINQTIDLQEFTKDDAVVISMLDNPAKTFRKFKIPGRPGLIAALDDLAEKMLEHVATTFRVGIGPLADNFCDGCNMC